MRIGYACKTEGVEGTAIRSCILKNASEERLHELITINLDALWNILRYNQQNGILMFRISSDIIPFGSLDVNAIPWWEVYQDKLRQIGSYAKQQGMRLSMHPGQYTILNALKSDIVERSVDDLIYHARFLDALGLDASAKMILHIGGIYGEKEKAIQRFLHEYHKLPDLVKKHLVIENDDRLFNTADVLAISKECGVPVVFDNLHHEILPSAGEVDEMAWLKACKDTWNPWDGQQKIHYANQEEGKRIGSHSQTIHMNHFLDFFHRLPENKPDIMLEVKDKNLSAKRCIQALKKSEPKIDKKVLK